VPDQLRVRRDDAVDLTAQVHVDDPAPMRGGFWTGAWCGSDDCEAEISARTKATIRFLPIEPREPGSACMHCGRPGVDTTTWARAY
jgi:hypothetical protein